MSSTFLNDENKGDIVIYQSESGETKIDVRFQDETVWLTQAQLCELYQSSRANVSEHIKNIFEEGELEQSAVVRKIRTTAADGKTYAVNHYNLDMIISLGYRIKSSIATQFRRWATERLKEYMIKGFTMDDERLKNLGGGSYWKELLDRILASTGEALLTDGGTVSHTQAMEKAKAEYRKYQAQNLSPVEEEYLQTIRSIEKAAKEGEKR